MAITSGIVQAFIDREKVAAMMLRVSIATGHGDTIDDLLGELEAEIKRREEIATTLRVENEALAASCRAAAQAASYYRKAL